MKIYQHKSAFGFKGDGGLGGRADPADPGRGEDRHLHFKIEHTGPELAELYATKGELVTVI
ncbi:MAG: hypothetical protein ACM3TT_02725, partial [Syntrophothermus sp.]